MGWIVAPLSQTPIEPIRFDGAVMIYWAMAIPALSGGLDR
jgi:hypothetical protein